MCIEIYRFCSKISIDEQNAGIENEVYSIRDKKQTQGQQPILNF